MKIIVKINLEEHMTASNIALKHLLLNFMNIHDAIRNEFDAQIGDVTQSIFILS